MHVNICEALRGVYVIMASESGQTTGKQGRMRGKRVSWREERETKMRERDKKGRQREEERGGEVLGRREDKE